MPGLVTRPARSQASGSRQTTSPHSWCRPTGVPAVGVPLPATKGYRPHSWVVVPWYSGPAATWMARPPSANRQPQAGARRAGRVLRLGALGWGARAGGVVGVAGGHVAAGAARVLAAELRRPDLAVQHAGCGRGGEWPVLHGDALGVGAGGDEAGEDVAADVLAWCLAPAPGH